ncbi:MAG: hypothetical protein ABIH23_32200 [bacterium]
MSNDQEAKGPQREELTAPVWCYECKKQFSFKLRPGASQKKLSSFEVERLVSTALHASKWQMLEVVDEKCEETGERTWFCDECVDDAGKVFEERRKKGKKPWWNVHR